LKREQEKKTLKREQEQKTLKREQERKTLKRELLVQKWLKCQDGGVNWLVKNLGYL